MTPNDVLTSPEEEFAQDPAYRRAKAKAVNMISHRPYTTRRLGDKLRELEYPTEIVDAVLCRLEEVGLLNDHAYGQEYFAYLAQRKRYGPRRIRSDMLERGVPAPVVAEILQDAQIDWVDNALFWLIKKYPNCCYSEKERRRAYQALGRYGFLSHEIRQAFEVFQEQLAEETEDAYDEKNRYGKPWLL